MSSLRYYEALRAEVIHLVKQERERRKLSKYAISQRSGVSQTMLGRVERGLRNPTLELVLRIADGVGTDLPAIIKKAKANISKQMKNPKVAEYAIAESAIEVREKPSRKYGRRAVNRPNDVK